MNLMSVLIVILLLGILAAVVLSRVGSDGGCPVGPTTTTIVMSATNTIPGLCP